MNTEYRILLSTTSYVEILEFFSSKSSPDYFYTPKIRFKIPVSSIFTAAHSSDGRFIAIAADFIYLCDLKNPEKLICVPGTEHAKHLVFGHNSNEIFFTKAKLSIVMNYHIETRKIVALSTHKKHSSPITCMAISNDDKFILTSSKNPSIILLQNRITHATDKVVSRISCGDVVNAAFHPKQFDLFLLCFSNGALEFYDAKKPICPLFKIKDMSITYALFLPNGESSAVSVDLNGQVSIIDFKKKKIEMKWSVNTPSNFLSISEQDYNGWNIFVLTSHGRCFYFNQDGVKLFEYFIDSEKILQVSMLKNYISINEEFLDIVVKNLNANVSKCLSFEDPQRCLSDEKIKSLNNNKILGTFSLESNSLQKNDKVQFDIDKLNTKGSNIYSQNESYIFEKKMLKNNLSVPSVGKENIPLEDSSKHKFTANSSIKGLSNLIHSNKNDILSSNRICDAQSAFKFETPKMSKKTLDFSTVYSKGQNFQENQTLEKSPEKCLVESKTPVSDIWYKLGTSQNIDTENVLSECFSKEQSQNLGVKDSIKETLSVQKNSPKSWDSISLNKDLSYFDQRKNPSADILTYRDMLFEAQKGIRQDIQNLHIELIKQFMLQKIEFEKILKYKNKEIKNLKKQNKKLIYELNLYKGC
ncbi:hypothetical protein PORY_001731 [Pneumocystis oryctolagi]|uniref:Uncharacterized protein n=1 Tax=Pneumocystis oryctolagi TaxID=42067 RepID=A0ACB7CBD3_9ASCO|nr:hypothetical protein PORY_001731 [Pneumocystis oryctolagi]